MRSPMRRLSSGSICGFSGGCFSAAVWCATAASRGERSAGAFSARALAALRRRTSVSALAIRGNGKSRPGIRQLRERTAVGDQIARDCQTTCSTYDFAHMKWFSALVAALLIAAPLVHAIGPDEDYIAIYQLIEDGDQALANNQTAAARQKFQAAQEALKKFKATYPIWNEKTVDFRIQYVNERLAKLAPAAPVAPTTSTPTPAATKPAVADPTAELRQQVAGATGAA